VPGILIAGCGVVIWLFMIVKPEDVGIELAPSEPSDEDVGHDNFGAVVVSHPFKVCPVVFVSEFSFVGYVDKLKIPG